ncbi:hypothetical protein ACJMK2_033407 [Sinanodonta woodiana]|uniref:histone acetyltransferase n=1 Tax=Sinanodonta woodiana TaxID=1069815 RepID=A0ABD3WPM6_SINWO
MEQEACIQGSQISSDEKKRLILQQLDLLFHAITCIGENGPRCPKQVPHCQTVKDVLHHMTQCSAVTTCAYKHCTSSREIIKHWNSCHCHDCPICSPFSNRGIASDIFNNLSRLATSQGGSQPHDDQPGRQLSRDCFTPGQLSHVDLSAGSSIQNDFPPHDWMAHVNSSIGWSLNNDLVNLGEGRASPASHDPNTICRQSEDEISFVNWLPSSPVEYDDFLQNDGANYVPDNPQQTGSLAIDIADHIFVDQMSPVRPNADEVILTEASTTIADNRSRWMNIADERRKEIIHKIVDSVLPDTDGDSLYIGYSMLSEFAKATESKIYNTVNGMNEYQYYVIKTIDTVKRSVEDWKRQHPDKEFNIHRDLFGMDMQDFLDKAKQTSSCLLTNASTVSGNTSTISHSYASSSNVSSDNETRSGTSDNRFEPYPSTSGISARRSRSQRSRQYSKAYSVCFYSKSDLPSRSQRCRTILEAVIDILIDDSENDIRDKLKEILEVKHGYHSITKNDLVILKSARRQLDLPVSPSGFQWNGDRLRRLIGNGKLHVMLQTQGQMDSSLGRSCSFDKCERNDSRRRQLESFSSSELSSEDSIWWTDDDDILMDDEAAMSEAIRRSMVDQGGASSLSRSGLSTKNKEKIERALCEHAEKVIRGPPRSITVKRDEVWNAALEFFRKPDFVREFGSLEVHFKTKHDVAEEGVDNGGPRREFCRLLIKEICHKSGVLVETPNGLVPRNNIRQLQEGLLIDVGRMIATIVMQGGEPPSLFSPLITQCILKDAISTEPDVDDIPDLIVRESLRLIQQATDQGALERALESCEWRFDVDGLPLFVKMENKDEFVKASAMHFAVLTRQTGIQQLLHGLKYYDFLGLMRRKPFLCNILEYRKDAISAKDLIYIFEPEYSFSDDELEKEQKLFSNLNEFLKHTEDQTLILTLDEAMIHLTAEERDFISSIQVSKLLEFCTGSNKVPALGFEVDPHMTFVHDDHKFHPSAHTCGNNLVLYVNDKTTLDKSAFFKIMVETLMNAENFGFD